MHIHIGLGLRIKTLNDRLMFVEVSRKGEVLNGSSSQYHFSRLLDL